MNFEISTRSKVILTLGVPATALLLYWLLRNREDDDEDEEEKTVVTSRQARIEVKVPSKAVGPLIGRQGANIKKLQTDTGTRICFQDDMKREPGQDRVLVIRGTTEKAQQAEIIVLKVISDMPTILTEEMMVPVQSLGRIIGRNGDSIRQISSSSSARINIDRSRDVRDITKQVSIIGSRQQIDIAKTLLQEKVDEEEVFRARAAVMAANREQRNKRAAGPTQRSGPVQTTDKYMTSEDSNVSDQTPSQQPVTITTNIMGWPGTEYVEVYISSVADPHHFWVQLVTSMALQLDELVQNMTSLYNSDHNRNVPDHQYERGEYVAALYERDNSWYRAIVMGVETEQLDLYFVDYGDSGFADIKYVRPLRSDFLELPFQAIQCCLGHVDVKGDEWTEDAINCFEDLTYAAKWKVVMAKKISSKVEEGETLHIVDLIDTNSPADVNIAQELVKHGCAIWDET